MSEIVACFTASGIPLTSPVDTPTIRIRRIDTQALVVTDDAMTEIGDGCFSYTFTPSATLEYTIRADGDPLANGQLSAEERYKFGSLSGITVNALELQILEIYQLHGLETGSDLVVTLTSRTAAAISQTIFDDTFGTITVSRP